MSEHPLQDQWDWLKRLPTGSRLVRGDKTEWLKLDMGAVVHHRGGNDYWVNLSSGDTIHFSFLADKEKPPRLYTKPSPFVLEPLLKRKTELANLDELGNEEIFELKEINTQLKKLGY